MALDVVAILVLARLWWTFVLRGILGIAFGVVVVLFPGTGILSVLLLAGLFSIAFGVAMVLLGFRLRQIHATAVRQHEYAERGLPD